MRDVELDLVIGKRRFSRSSIGEAQLRGIGTGKAREQRAENPSCHDEAPRRNRSHTVGAASLLARKGLRKVCVAGIRDLERRHPHLHLLRHQLK